MSENFLVRFIEPSEISRVAELLKELQNLQKMKICPRIPTGDDLTKVIAYEDPVSGKLIPNNCGTFTIIVIDKTKMDDSGTKSYIVGYLIYTEAFSIMIGAQYYINSFFIEANYRRSGLGQKLMDFVFEHARFRGIYRVDIPVMRANAVGRKFYARYSSYNIEDEYKMRSIPMASLVDRSR